MNLLFVYIQFKNRFQQYYLISIVVEAVYITALFLLLFNFHPFIQIFIFFYPKIGFPFKIKNWFAGMECMLLNTNSLFFHTYFSFCVLWTKFWRGYSLWEIVPVCVYECNTLLRTAASEMVLSMYHYYLTYFVYMYLYLIISVGEMWILFADLTPISFSNKNIKTLFDSFMGGKKFFFLPLFSAKLF